MPTDAATYLVLLHNYCTATWEDHTSELAHDSFQVAGLRIAIDQEYIQVYKSALLLQSIHCSVGIYAVLENVRRVVFFMLKY